MLKKNLIPLLLIVLPNYSHASQLSLEFSVAIHSKHVNNLTIPSYNSNITFLENITIDTSLISQYQGSANTNSTNFPLTYLQATPVTSDVLSNFNSSIGQEYIWPNTNVYGTYNVNGIAGNGTPETSQSIDFRLDRGTRDRATYLQQEYIRDISFHSILPGNVLTQYDGASLQAYLESLIGNSNFFFSENYNHFTPFGTSGFWSTDSSYGYFGNATLINVSSIPVPSAIWLFGSALVGFIGFNRRKTIQQ